MTLRLTLFGPFQLRFANDPPLNFRTNKIRALLAYLAAENGRSHTRHTLATLLWPEVIERRARQNLSQAIHRLRKTVDGSEPGLSSLYLQITRQTITVLPNPAIFCDVVAFGQLLSATKTHRHISLLDCTECLARLDKATALYQGDFLAGFHLRDSAPFEEWLMFQREKYQLQALQALEILIKTQKAQGDYAQVERYARRLLVIEPWNELGWQNLMLSLAQQGQRSHALAQFEACQAQLWETLGVKVNAETLRIAERIRQRVFEVDASEPSPMTEDVPIHADSARDLPLTAVSVPQPQHNLPPSETPFFNRVSEKNSLSATLRKSDRRWVTIIGEGGVGKTRLATEIGKRLVTHFTDGVWFVPLAGIQAEETSTIKGKIITAIANAVGLPLNGTENLQGQLIRYLKPKKMLLIFDNFEHLLEGGDLLTTLLQQIPQLQLLCTSRVPLQFRSEHVLHLRGLKTPEIDHFGSSIEPACWQTYPSLELFVSAAERATFAQPDLTEANIQIMSNICHWVGGNALGIELAASWLRHMTLPEVWEALQESHHFLTTHLRDVPFRHRSMHLVFEQSWHLLEPQAQAALVKLSVFRSGFTAAAAQAVGQVLSHALLQLIQEVAVQRTGSGRYRMHEALRQFAAERLPEAKAQAVRQNHLQYYFNFLAEREADLQGTRPQEPAREIDVELDNIRQAWRHLLEREAYELLPQGIVALSNYFQLRGYSREAKELFQTTLEQVCRTHKPALISIAAQLAREAARFQLLLADYQKGGEIAETAVLLAQRCGDKQTEGAAYIFQAEAYWRQGAYEAAQERLEHALPIVQKEMKQPVAGSFYFHQGVVYDLCGEPGLAISMLQQAAEIWQRLGHRRAQATTLNSLGLVAYHQHQLTQAYYAIWQANQIQRELGNLFGQMVTSENLSLIAIHQQQFDEAEALLKEVRVLAAKIANPLSEAKSYKAHGWIELERKRPEVAYSLLQKGLELFQELGHINGQAEIWCLLGKVHMLAGRDIETERCLKIGLMLAQEVQNSYTECLAHLSLAELYQQQSQKDRQFKTACSAFELATQLNNTEFIDRAESLLPELNEDFSAGMCLNAVFA